MSSSRDVDMILEIVRGGKYGFLDVPTTAADVVEAIKRIVPSQTQPPAATKKDGKVYVCAGVNGGAGNTTYRRESRCCLGRKREENPTR